MTFDIYTEIIDAINRIDVDGQSSLNIVLDLHNVKLSDVEDMITKNYQIEAINFLPAMKAVMDVCIDKSTQKFSIKKFLIFRHCLKHSKNAPNLPYLPYKIHIENDPSTYSEQLKSYGPKDFTFLISLDLFSDIENMHGIDMKTEIQRMWFAESEPSRMKYYNTL